MTTMGWKHASELHSCRHCDRIVITQRQIRNGFIELPHTMLEAIQAAKDRCPVFRYLWLDTEAAQSSEHLRRMELQERLKSYSFEQSRNVENGSDLIRQPLFLRLGPNAVIIDSRINPIDIALRYKLQVIGGSAESIVQERDALHGVLDNTMESYQCIAKIRRNLSECLSKHAMCHIPAVGFAPSRLLDVSLNLSPTLIRLFETDRSRRYKWASLSYVWGTEQPHKTTKSLLLQYIEGICIADLPQTIRDAVTVCRTFDIPNLWVDSLCIVQDDVTDKTRELPLMAEVYRHSLLTISAACARSVNDGFLGTGRPFCYRDVAPTALLYQGSDGSTARALALVENPYDRETHKFTDPIHKRAWTLQERLLSPRLLTYSSHGVIWSCRSWYCRDDLEEFWGPQHRQGVGPGREAATLPCIPGFKMLLWDEIVEQYTPQDMALPSDKLVALSAVAQAYSQNADEYGTYLAGVWKETMPRSLMWYVPKGSARCRPDVYRAPSWSWASVNSQVKSGELELRRRKQLWPIDEPDPKVMIAETTPAVKGFPFGAVVGGTLVLDAKTRRCSVREIDKAAGWLRLGDGSSLSVLEDTDEFWKLMSTVDTAAMLVYMNGAGYIQPGSGLILVEAGDNKWRRVAVFDRCYPYEWSVFEYFRRFERKRITIV